MKLVADLESLVKLRKELHKNPELSGSEELTAGIISGFIRKLRPDEIIYNLGGRGLAARFRGPDPGPRVMVRAELDAVPVHESNDFEYRSAVPGISHVCGHDGHMAIAAGVAAGFSYERPERGELVVLYQPSEENGKGAGDVINDPLFSSLRPDFILALHNLPGFQRNALVLGDGVFAAASVGMITELTGKSSHAGEPENGVSPSTAVSRILQELPVITERDDFRDFTLATIIHARIGEVAFGTSPGEAVIMATLRAFNNRDMLKLTERAESLVRDIALSENLRVAVSWTEEFPATENDAFLTGTVAKLGHELGFDVHYIDRPFKWSEDFAFFARNYRGILFGLGAGKEHPDLHNPDYDFPDEITVSGVKILTSVCRELMKGN